MFPSERGSAPALSLLAPTATKRRAAQKAESIRSQGVLSPLLVRPLTDQSFEIVAGARRYRAAQIAEAPTVLRVAAHAYGVDTDAITVKVKQEFAAKEKAKNTRKPKANTAGKSK